MKAGKKATGILYWAGFIFYSVFIVWNILFKYVAPWQLFNSGRYFSGSLNLIPFHDLIGGYYNQLDLFGNIIIFIPLGIYLCMFLKEKKVIYALLLSAAVSLFFEVSQYVLAIGASDITDIITNTAGGLWGIGIYLLIRKIFKEENKIKIFVTVCSTIVLALVSVLLVLLFLGNR